MAAELLQECNPILLEFLGEKTLGEFDAKHKDNRNTGQFLKDVFDVICEGFPQYFEQDNEVFVEKGECKFNLVDLASQIPKIFSSRIVFHTSAEYLKELETAENYLQCLKICRILREIIKSSSFEWVGGVTTQELKDLEKLEFEESKKTIIEFLSSLLNLASLMPFDAEQLKSHGKLKLMLYPCILQLCHIVVQKISENLCVEFHKNFKSSVLRCVACEIVIACLQQIGNHSWILDNCKKIAMEILDSIVTICGSHSVVDLLCGNDYTHLMNRPENDPLFPNGLLGRILENMKTLMAKYKLPDCPVAMHVLVWSVTNVKHPYLGKHISMILPPLLLLIDDYRVENRVTGIETLSHVIENTNTTELCWYGRADIIYDALHHRIHTNEPLIMRVLQPCLLKIIKVLEPSSKKAIAEFRTNKCDENFQIILTAMEYESKILMRRAYCSDLASFVNHMGVNIVRHFKRLLRVVFSYLEIGDGETEEWRMVMLDVLKCVIVNAWPRIPVHADGILKCLAKLIIDVTMSSIAPREVKEVMFEKIKECLVMLLCVCGEAVKNKLDCMTTGLGLDEAEKLISDALDVYKSNSQVVGN